MAPSDFDGAFFMPHIQLPCSEEERFIIDQITRASEKLKTESFVIGGFVRDKILNRPTKDMDIVCLGDGNELAETFAEQFNPPLSVSHFKNFGTAQVKYHHFEVEFVGARKESYRSDSRKPMIEVGTLEDDQNRRDLTINAMALSLRTHDYGSLLDPFNGLQDIEEKRLRTPLPPDSTFSDDPLRMMRVIRFASQLHFNIEDETLGAIKRNASRLAIISKERIIDELHKIMLSTKPSIGLALLYQTGLLQEFFPELAALAGTENIEGKGHKDNFYHTIQVVDQISLHTNNLWLRWAALLHDIGKPSTKKFEVGLGWTFHGHEWIGSKMIPGIFKRLKMPQHEQMKYVQKLVQLHHRPVSLTSEDITDSAMRRLLFDAGDELDDLMTLCNADITSKNPDKVKRYRANYELVKIRLKEVEESDHIRNWQPPITGEIIMETFNLSPSRTVGLIKDAVREAILDGLIKNDFEEAFQFMITKANELHLQPVKKA